MKLFSKGNSETGESAPAKASFFKRLTAKKSKKQLGIIAAILVVVIVAGCFFAYKGFFDDEEAGGGMITAQASIGEVSSVIEGSGVIEAIEQYDITSLKKGEITADFFKEGDTVEKDSVLYQMDDEDGHTSIENAKTSLDNAEDAVESAGTSVEKAQRTLNDANEDVANLSVKSDMDGVITNMYISVGDSINANGKIADVVNNRKMILEIQFLADYASSIYTGAGAEVTLSKSGAVLYGSVSRVSSGSVVNSVGAKVSNVEITVDNPGSVEKGDYATAVVGSYACSSEGTFRYSEEGAIYSEVSGKVKKLDCILGDNVYNGKIVATLENSSLSDSVRNARESLDEAQRNLSSKQKSLEEAREKYNEAVEGLEDYTVTAPISGKIIQKNIKAGENLENSNESSAMATIADLSSLVFSMSVDELDVMSIEAGMEVEITADAIENVTFSGMVTNVSIMGTSQNGVTSYPVEITFDSKEEQQGRAKESYDDLIPGLNVSARIVIEKVEDVLVVPVSAVRRGNIVIIRDDSESEGIGFEAAVPAGMTMGGGEASADMSQRERASGSDGEMPQRPGFGAVSDGEMTDMPRGGQASGASKDETGESTDSAQNTDNKAKQRMQAMIDALDIPEGYKAVVVETGLSDESFIEIKRGLAEGDTILLPDTTESSTETQMPMQGAMPGGMGGGMPGGMGGGMPGGMAGGNRGAMSGGGMR